MNETAVLVAKTLRAAKRSERAESGLHEATERVHTAAHNQVGTAQMQIETGLLECVER